MATKDISDLMVCYAYQAARLHIEADGKPSMFADSILKIMTGQPEKVCYRAMERAFKRGLVGYGVTLRSGWLTEKGRQLLDGGGHD